MSQAVAEVLRAGGNAFDGIVAAGFASTAAEPLLSSLGGGGFALTRTAQGDEVLYDFFASAPGLGLDEPPASQELDFDPVVVTFLGEAQVFHVGWGSVAVPGMLKGLLHVHRRLGRLPLDVVVEPAAALARDGVRVTDFQHALSKLLEPIIRYGTEAGRYYLTPEGELLSPGATFDNPELAAFLSDLPRQPEGLYTGDLAARVATAMRDGRGLLTRMDLAAYQVIERAPLTISYRGERLLTNPGPSLGGPLLALALSLQEEADLSGETWGSPGHLGVLTAVLREVERIRAVGGSLPPLVGAHLDEARRAVRLSTGGTTHMNVADAEGNVASLTASNGEGCGHFAPGTGIMLNNMMGEDDLHPEGFHTGRPGARISSMMAPSMLVDEEGVMASLGTGGSKRIRTALQQAITNLLDFRLPAEDAANLPRIHLSQDTLQVEPGYSAEGVAALEALAPVNLWTSKDVYFGGVHLVVPRTGDGAGDQRRGGHFMVVDS